MAVVNLSSGNKTCKNEIVLENYLRNMNLEPFLITVVGWMVPQVICEGDG